jgi:hypothetical protein
MPRRINSRDIPEAVQRILWAKAAGRCQFAGCNEPLWRSSVTQETINKAQKAHIYAFSGDGPRRSGVTSEKINDMNNLMLVCHQCHQKMDKEKDGGRYTAELLQGWKKTHERRVEIVTGIDPERRSHILMYGAGIGDHSSPLSFKTAASAMFPDRYPADDKPIEIPNLNSWHRDRNEEFWRLEYDHLVKMFERRVRERLNDGEIAHISVFALAPQPLLISLGSLLTDIPEVDVFQRHREPQTWEWQPHSNEFKYIVEEPDKVKGPPALILSLSAFISDDRIRAIMGNDATLWKVSIPEPDNDFLRSKEQLREFRVLARRIMRQIKDVHGQKSIINVFPAAPVSVAVELGRIRQPKADLPLRIYDQVNDRGGFVPAIEIGLLQGDSK